MPRIPEADRQKLEKPIRTVLDAQEKKWGAAASADEHARPAGLKGC